MDLNTFRSSLHAALPAQDLSEALKALWYDAQGDWQMAHQHAQAQQDSDGAWVHAYLHRKEGDLPNAAYWYRQAGRAPEAGPLPAEWEAIATALLAPQA